MNILYLLASNSYSGAENVVCTIINNLDEKHNAYYCSPKGPIEKTLKEKNIKYIETDFSIKNLKHIIKEYKIDVIHANDYKASFISCFLGFKGKIISHLHCNYPFAKKWNLYTLGYSLIAKKFNIVLGVSSSVKEEAIFKNRIEDKFVLMYNYVNKDEIIEKSKMKYDKKYDLYFIGRLVDAKNPIKFVEFVKKIKENKKNIKAVMIGDGVLKETIFNKIEQENLTDNIELLGFLDNPFKVINNCKIGIMPSIYEGFGLTAIESMVLGKPLLNTYVGGLNEIFSDNKEFVIDEELVLKLLNDKKLYDKFSKKTIEIAKKYTNKVEYQRSINDLYE